MSERRESSRRWKRLAIREGDFTGICRGERVLIFGSGIPDDVKVKRAAYDFAADSLYVIIEHESFAEIPPHSEIPMVSTVETRLFGPRAETLFDMLALVDREMSISDYVEWTILQQITALDYAAAAHLNASDHDDIVVPREPPHVAKLPRLNDARSPRTTEIVRILGYLRMMAKGDTVADPDALQQLIDQLAS